MNTCRGVMRRDLMYKAPSSGSGLGLFLFAAWYAAGPAAAVLALTLPFAQALRADSATTCGQALGVGVMVAVVLLWWARTRASELTGLSRPAAQQDR